MMRGVSTWAVAVRKPLPEQIADGRELEVGEGAQGEIETQSFPLVSWAKRHRALRWPVIRGVVALAESLNIGFKALNISANAQLPEDEEEISGAMWAGDSFLIFSTRVFWTSVSVGMVPIIRVHAKGEMQLAVTL